MQRGALMSSRQSVRGPWSRPCRPAVLMLIAILGACDARSYDPTPSSPPSGASPFASPTAGAAAPASGSVVIVGRIVTMSDQPVAEAVFIEDGVVRAVGDREEVLSAAGDGVP